MCQELSEVTANILVTWDCNVFDTQQRHMDSNGVPLTCSAATGSNESGEDLTAALNEVEQETMADREQMRQELLEGGGLFGSPIDDFFNAGDFPLNHTLLPSTPSPPPSPQDKTPQSGQAIPMQTSVDGAGFGS